MWNRNYTQIMFPPLCLESERSCPQSLSFAIRSTRCFIKKNSYIYDYNSRISWSIFIILTPVDTGMNTPQYHVTYLLNCLITWQVWNIACHESLLQLVTKFCQQSSGRKYFTFAWVVIRNLSLNSIWLILACEIKLNGRDLRRVTVMTS